MAWSFASNAAVSLVPKLNEGHLPDIRGEFHSLAGDLQRSAIHSIFFSTKFHVGELDTLAHLITDTLLRSEEAAKRFGAGGWPARLREQRVSGIHINTLTERNVDSVLASLIAALVAYGGNAPKDESGDAPIRAPQINEITESLRLIGRLTPPMEVARGLSAEDAARAIHPRWKAPAGIQCAHLLTAMTHYSPQEGEAPQVYLNAFRSRSSWNCSAPNLPTARSRRSPFARMLNQLADEVVAAGEYRGPHSSQHFSSLASAWANDGHREELLERFWLELAPREKSIVLRGPDIWCVPIAVVRRTLAQFVEADAEAPRREARTILLNYARRLEHIESAARRIVAAGLSELSPLLERLWPNQLPEELAKLTLTALAAQQTPGNHRAAGSVPGNSGPYCSNRGDFRRLRKYSYRARKTSARRRA